ncbi:hypothetical protein CTI12_AA357840 [Artemisia annua]|uniref:Uncharacterized protein n=1 Tax=Artemisia annua TaxID=35608 RepID=A0A2U1MRE5_ARTAN|nr:hypothetical protein CTI12_AA357840 [Artemisia annua]
MNKSYQLKRDKTQSIYNTARSFGPADVNISGGSMNPARSFGPVVVSGDFSQIWIYCFALFFLFHQSCLRVEGLFL